MSTKIRGQVWRYETGGKQEPWAAGAYVTGRGDLPRTRVTWHPTHAEAMAAVLRHLADLDTKLMAGVYESQGVAP